MTSEPPLLPDSENRAGDELTVLTEMLDFQRAVLIRKANGLTQEQLGATLGPSNLTIGGLVLHMALVEDIWFHDRFLGEDRLEPWAGVDWEIDRDWELDNGGSWSYEALVEQFETSVARSRTVARAAALDDRAAFDGPPTNLRWIFVHMIEEYARHLGHADLIRESIDGATGD